MARLPGRAGKLPLGLSAWRPHAESGGAGQRAPDAGSIGVQYRRDENHHRFENLVVVATAGQRGVGAHPQASPCCRVPHDPLPSAFHCCPGFDSNASDHVIREVAPFACPDATCSSGRTEGCQAGALVTARVFGAVDSRHSGSSVLGTGAAFSVRQRLCGLTPGSSPGLLW